MKIDLFKDMMRFPLSFLVLLLVCATSSAQTINAQYLFSNYTTTPSSVKQITLTPLRPNGNYAGPILIPSPIVRVTSTNGAYTYSNVVTGYRYSIDLFDGVNHYTFTNNFPLGLTNTTAGYVNAASYLGIQTGDYFAYFTATNFSITTNYFNVTNSFVITNNISGTNFSVDITTNATIATNGNTYIISVPNQSFLTNGLASLAQLQATNNILASTKLQANVFWTNMLGTGAWTNSLVAGTNATISTNLSGLVTLNVPTPSFLTNGFTDKTVTNGLATTNFVTNAISSAINVATNGLVTAAVTNGLSTTNYVNTSTNTIGIPSGLMAFQLTNVWATYNALTNYITITSNGITAGTGISAATATNIVKANAWILGGNTNSGFFGTLSNQTLNVGANSMTGLVITAFVDANDTNFYFNFGSKNTLTNFYNSAILSGEGNYLASPFFGFYPFPVGGYAGLIGGGYYNTNQGEDFAVILMGYKNAITADPYTLIGNGSSNSVGSDYASILNGYGNTIVINPSGVLDFGETILNGGNNFLQSAYSWIGGGIGNTIIYNTAGVSSPDYNAIINGTGNSITNSKNSTIASGVGNSIKSANGSFIFGSSATINSNNVAILNDGSVTSSKTNSQMILVFTNGVSINTNYANGYALFVNGSINATNMYVNGVAVATTSSAGSVGGLTNITVATNGTVYTVSVPTQAFLTNGFTTMVYSNPANMATVAYVNTVGLGATNLSYLVGQGNTNFSYLIGQAGTNLFNQAGVNLTNISSTISNNLLNFVQITNGTAFYPTLKSNITLGVFPWLTTSTNVLGINNAGVVPANGTYLQIATGTWTNVIGNGSDVIYQNPTYFLRTNLVNLYSTSNLFFNSTWLNVIGSSSVPTNSGFGYIANHNGQWDTNIWAQGLIGIVPMVSLDTTKVVTNNSSPNFNNTAVGNLTVNGFQTNNSNVYFNGNITGGKYFGDGFGLTNLNLSITNGGGSIFNTTVIGNQGFLASSNVAFGSSATWFGAHSYNSQDTILSLPTTGSGGITNGGLILWPEAGGGITVANSDGSATLMRIDDITNQATGLIYTGQVTANKFIASQFAGTFTGNVVATNGNVSFPTKFFTYQLIPIATYTTTNPFDAWGWQQNPIINDHYAWSTAGYYTNQSHTNILFKFNSAFGTWEYIQSTNLPDSGGTKGIYYYVGSQNFPTNATPTDWVYTNGNSGPTPYPPNNLIGTITGYMIITNFYSSAYEPIELHGYSQSSGDIQGIIIGFYDSTDTNQIAYNLGGVANQGNTGIVYVRGTNSSGIYMNNIGSYFVEQDDTRIWIQRTRGGVTAKPFGDTVLESRSIDPTIESTTYNNYTRINEFGRYAIGRLGPEGETDTNFGIPGWVSVFGGNTNGIFNTPTFVIMPTTTLSTVKTNGALNNDGIRIQADQQGVRFPIPQVQQTNVQLSAASTFTWTFQYPYGDTNYSITCSTNFIPGAYTTTSAVLNFQAFTGKLQLIAAHQ